MQDSTPVRGASYKPLALSRESAELSLSQIAIFDAFSDPLFSVRGSKSVFLSHIVTTRQFLKIQLPNYPQIKPALY